MKLEGVIYCGDNLYWMSRLPDEFVDLCYIDPPFFANKNYEVIFGDGEELKQLSPTEFQNWVIGAAGGRVSDKKSRDMGIDGYTFYGLYGEKVIR